jgi:AcrR family transcriptional regulator
MERVAALASVSKALVYAYFGNRTNLLSALLVREYPAFKATDAVADTDQRSFEEIVRESTCDYLNHVREKGVLLQRLAADPGVVAAVGKHHRIGREHTVRYFAAAMARDYPISEEKAAVVADILMGVTGAAGNLLARERMEQRRISELVVRIILAGVRRASGGADVSAAPAAVPRTSGSGDGVRG